MSDLSFHDAANIFPMLDDEQLDAMVADIQANGLHIPVELLDGKIIDGRNRYLACLMAKVEPDIIDVEPDCSPVDYVLSMNLHRRHLDESQRAMVGARAREHYEKAAKERQKRKPKSVVENLPPQEKGKARDQAGAAVKVSGKTVDHATKVVKQGSKELQEAVDKGEVAVSKAAKLADLPKAEQNKAIKGGKAAVKAATTPTLPPKSIADTLFNRLRDLADRVNGIRDQFETAEAMFKSKEWRGADTYVVREMVHELFMMFRDLDKEMQEYAKANDET